MWAALGMKKGMSETEPRSGCGRVGAMEGSWARRFRNLQGGSWQGVEPRTWECGLTGERTKERKGMLQMFGDQRKVLVRVTGWKNLKGGREV